MFFAPLLVTVFTSIVVDVITPRFWIQMGLNFQGMLIIITLFRVVSLECWKWTEMFIQEHVHSWTSLHETWWVQLLGTNKHSLKIWWSLDKNMDTHIGNKMKHCKLYSFLSNLFRSSINTQFFNENLIRNSSLRVS